MKSKIIRLVVLITIILIIIDQISKVLIEKNYVSPIGNKVIKIELTENTGIAFGLNSGNTRNIFISLIIILLIVNFLKNQLERIDKKTAIAISFILAGGIGNLIDRIFKGHVIDFISLNKFAIFNLADIFIVFGWILMIIFLIKYARFNNVKE